MAKKKFENSHTFCIVNKTRKTYTLSNSKYCYRLSGKDGREVTEPSEKFTVYGTLVKHPPCPKGYKKQIVN